jgi:hypothetical protein
MNRKQLTLILIAGALIGAAAILSYSRKAQSWKSSSQVTGQKLLADFPLNDIAHLLIKNSSNELNLVKQEDLWRVKERFNYPANFGDISDFLRKSWELKAIQTEQVGPSQLPRLELVEPGLGTPSGTLVEYKDVSGKTVRSLLLGKKHLRKPAGAAASPFGDEGWPDGRYVLVPGGSHPVALINDALTSIEPKPEQWLNKDFFKVEKIQSIAVVHTNTDQSWTLSRETETGEFKLADLKEGESLDSGKISGMNSLLSWPSFTDVVSPDAAPETLGLDHPLTATITTFDGFTYAIRIGHKSGEDNYHFRVSTSAAIAQERAAPADEKAEDKERLDKEFKEKQTKLAEKLKQESALSPWTYVVSKWTVDNLLKERKDLFADKKTESSTDAPIPPSPPGLDADQHDDHDHDADEDEDGTSTGLP